MVINILPLHIYQTFLLYSVDGNDSDILSQYEPEGFDWPLWRSSERISLARFMSQRILPISESLKFSRAEGFVSSFVFLVCCMFLALSLLSHLFFHLLFHLQNISHMMTFILSSWMKVLVKDLCNPDVVTAIAKARWENAAYRKINFLCHWTNVLTCFLSTESSTSRISRTWLQRFERSSGKRPNLRDLNLSNLRSWY